MSSIDEYMNIPYKMEVVPDTAEGGFAVSIPQLCGCISCGDTLDEAMHNIEDAKRAWIEAALEDGYPIPEPEDDTQCSGQFKLRLPKSLNR